MSIRFKTINGTLCRMVEQPCLHCGSPEIIATPVVEGSANWAVYMAQQGNFVCHPVLGTEEYFWWNTEKNCMSCKSCDIQADSFFTCFMLSGIQDSGWQIHEPEPKPEFKIGGVE